MLLIRTDFLIKYSHAQSMLDDFSVISASHAKANNHCVKGRYFLCKQTTGIQVLISSCLGEALYTKRKPQSLGGQRGTDCQGNDTDGSEM